MGFWGVQGGSERRIEVFVKIQQKQSRVGGRVGGWYGVNSYSSQFVLKSIRTHFGQIVLSFRSIRTHLVKFSQLVLILFDSYSVWSIRTHAKIILLIR